jgi:hypothetical protein
MPTSHAATSVRSALYTVLTLFGGALAGVIAGNLLFEALPGHSITNPPALNVALAAVPAVAGILGGAAVWGILMGRCFGRPASWRLARTGIVAFVPITVLLTVVLQLLEPLAVERFSELVPIHRLFTFFFVPTAFLIAGVSAWVIGRELVGGAWAGRLFWQVGLVAAAVFLVVNLLMEGAGWVVGAPRAAERFTMLTVMFVGNLAAALAGGALLGWQLHRRGTAGR